MKKFVSAIAALAIVTAMAVPAMAATEADVIAALQNAGAATEYVDAAKTYLNSVELKAETLDTVVANVNAAAAQVANNNVVGAEKYVKAAQTAINSDPGAANNQIVIKIAADGDVNKVVVQANGISVGADVKDGKVAPINTLVPSTGTGSNASNPVKATGVSMNVTAAMTAALAMAASMGAAVVYSVKKGLLAK